MKGMREMRLKKWVKVTLTVMLLLSVVIIYSQLGKWGDLAQNSRLYENLIFFGWCWMIGTPFMMNSIWE